jgi:tetratricopeptide (TPR) repeat protein
LLNLGLPEGTLEILHEAEKLAQVLNDGKGLITVYSRIGHYHSLKGNPSLGLEYSEKSLDQAEKMQDVESIAQSARYRCLTYIQTGNYIKVFDISKRAITIIEEHQRERELYFGVNVYSVLCAWCGHALMAFGEKNKSEKIFEKGRKIAHECSDKYAMGVLEYMHVSLLYFYGEDGNKIIDRAQKMIRYWEEAGVDMFIGHAWAMLGSGYSLLGEYETAIIHTNKGLTIQKKIETPFQNAHCYFLLAMAHIIGGDWISAKASAEEGMKYAQECESKSNEGGFWQLLGRISGRTDPTNIDEAQRYIRHGISILEEWKLKLFSTLGYLFLGELFAEAGRKDEALENLKKAESMYLDMKVIPESYWLIRTQKALAKLG